MLNLNWDIIWTFVNILVLFVLLKLFLFKPVNAMIEKRRKLIDGQLSDAAQKQKEAEAEKKIALEHEQMLKNAKSEIAAVAVMAAQKLAVKHADAEADSALLESLIQEAGAMK